MIKRQIFTGEINGVSLNNFKLYNENYNVYKIENSKDRINIVNDKISLIKPFLNEFSLDVNLTSTDYLSDNNPICKEIEKWGDYILSSKDVREGRKAEKKLGELYGFYIDKIEMNNLTNKECYLDTIIGAANSNLCSVGNNTDGNDDRVINFLNKNNKNFKRSKKITEKHYELNKGDYASYILNQYKDEIDRIDCIVRVIDGLKNITNDNKRKEWETKIIGHFGFIGKDIGCIEEYILNKYKGKRQILLKIKSSIKYDMEYCVLHLRGIFGDNPKNLLSDTTCPNWNEFDWNDTEQIKALMFVIRELNPDDDLSILKLSLDMIIEDMIKIGCFTAEEVLTLKLISEGYKQIEICQTLKEYRMKTTRRVNIIAKKISDYAIKKKGD